MEYFIDRRKILENYIKKRLILRIIFNEFYNIFERFNDCLEIIIFLNRQKLL